MQYNTIQYNEIQYNSAPVGKGRAKLDIRYIWCNTCDVTLSAGTHIVHTHCVQRQQGVVVGSDSNCTSK